VYAQNNKIAIDATFIEGNKLLIDQEITFFNVSKVPLDTMYLLNWANGYRDRNTPLSKRLLEDYNKSLYFAKPKERGYSKLLLLQYQDKNLNFQEPESASDLIKVQLPRTLASGDSINLHIVYEVQIPSDRFTRYGQKGSNYNLRYWHLTPAIFDKEWQLYSNLNMDDYYVRPTD
jgi:hypothetical protein